MNFMERLKCHVCEVPIDCRLGLSNRYFQPLLFACPSCGEPIYITMQLDKPPNVKVKVKNAKRMVIEEPFDGSNPFIDLHLDFPVKFGPYKMGHTPYMEAMQRVGIERMGFHFQRLERLNSLQGKTEELRRVLRLYGRNNDLFGRLCLKHFGVKMESSKPQDVNAALYKTIATVFSPFSLPTENMESVEIHMKGIRQATNSSEDAFNTFIKEIIDNSFLNNIQQDCLKIYPLMLDGELVFRPALFLDIDQNYGNDIVAFRVSSHDFNSFKDLYKDISEILSRQLTLVAGINNVIHRGDHNEFDSKIKHYPRSLNDFADIPYGFKLNHITDSWYNINTEAFDNLLRNSIAHFKTEYDPASQIVKYFPKKEGMKQVRSEEIHFLEFSRRMLASYREMHRLHHLIKCLFNYSFFILK